MSSSARPARAAGRSAARGRARRASGLRALSPLPPWRAVVDVTGVVLDSGAVSTTAQPSFSESLERSAELHQLQMWRAARTVRTHIAAGDELDAMLDCLGLADAQRPAGA